MTNRSTIASLIGAGTALAFGPAALAADDTMEICKTRAAAYDKTFEGGDAAKMASLYLSDAIENGPYGIVQGPKAIAAAYGGFVKPGVKHGHAVKGGRMLGNLAMCWGEWTFDFAPGSPTKGLAGRYTAIYAKNDSGWRIESLTYNFLPPPPAKAQ